MADDKKNPLDVLEELLGEASGGGGGAPKVDPKKAEADKEAAKEADLVKRKEAAETQRREQDVIDAGLLEKQRAAITTIKNHDEYKAREAQEKEKAEQKEERKDSGDGYEINQLGHTKV